MAVPGSTMTALEVIKSGLRLLNVIQSGEDPQAEEANDSLVILNQMLDTWNGDGLTIFTTQITDFLLTSLKQTYTLGEGGDFNMPRPAELDRCSILILSNPQQPIEYNLPIYTTQDWQSRVPVKTVQGNLPVLCYDDGAFPLRNITFWPNASDNIKWRLYSWQPLTQFGDLNGIAAFPPGYLEAIKYNLAVRLAPEFSTSVSAEVLALATSTLGQIKASNADDTQLRSDIKSSAMTGTQMRAELFGIATI
ncbi:MAG TPA: hypothetical protein VIY48_20545 [Candidatus Paceibacterota bacterium]